VEDLIFGGLYHILNVYKLQEIRESIVQNTIIIIQIHIVTSLTWQSHMSLDKLDTDSKESGRFSFHFRNGSKCSYYIFRG